MSTRSRCFWHKVWRSRLSQFEIDSTGNCVIGERKQKGKSAIQTAELREIGDISKIETTRFRKPSESVSSSEQNSYPREESQIDTM